MSRERILSRTSAVLWALCLTGAGGLIGTLCMTPVSMKHPAQIFGAVVGGVVGLIIAVRIRDSSRAHGACLLLGPFVMGTAFVMYAGAVFDAWDRPIEWGVIISYRSGAMCLSGLLMSLGGWFATRGET